MSSNTFRPLIVSALIMLGGLTGCDRNSDAPEADEPSAPAASQPADTPSSTSTAPASQPRAAAPSAPVTLQSPTVEVPKEVYSPNYDDIQRALAGVLVNTVASMPASPQRDKWYQQEATRLQTIKVSQCSASTPGTPSVCNIEMSGKAMQIKVLLTTSGWVVVK